LQHLGQVPNGDSRHSGNLVCRSRPIGMTPQHYHRPQRVLCGLRDHGMARRGKLDLNIQIIDYARSRSPFPRSVGRFEMSRLLKRLTMSRSQPRAEAACERFPGQAR
jgi:hypothetical protein